MVVSVVKSNMGFCLKRVRIRGHISAFENDSAYLGIKVS